MTQSRNSAVQEAGLERQVGVSATNYHRTHARHDNKVASVLGGQTNAGDSHGSLTQAKCQDKHLRPTEVALPH